MSAWGEVLVGLAIAVGLVGTVVQVLPGSFLTLAAIVVWGAVTGGPAGWAVLAVAVVVIGAAEVTKYLVAGRRLTAAGVARRSLVWGGLAGVVLFFVIPVLGLVIGFVGGVYLAELRRLRDQRSAWRATRVALGAAGLAILIDLAGVLLATAAWVVGLLIT